MKTGKIIGILILAGLVSMSCKQKSENNNSALLALAAANQNEASPSLNLVESAQLAKSNQPQTVYRFKVDSSPFTNSASELTGSQIRAIAGMNANSGLYLLVADKHTNDGYKMTTIAPFTNVTLSNSSGKNHFYSYEKFPAKPLPTPTTYDYTTDGAGHTSDSSTITCATLADKMGIFPDDPIYRDPGKEQVDCSIDVTLYPDSSLNNFFSTM